MGVRWGLHVSSDVVEDSEMRVSVTKKPRVDTDMEISAMEMLKNAKLEVDRALETANETLQLEEVPLESEAATKAAELSIRDKRLYTEVYENEADAKIISGRWVLKPHKARCVLRGFEEDVKDEGVWRLCQHDNDSVSEDATLASNGPQERRLHSDHSRRENRLSLRTHEGR